MTSSIGASCKRCEALRVCVLITHNIVFLRSYKIPKRGYKFGGNAGVDPPDPIPNSEVKYSKADDTGFVLGK